MNPESTNRNRKGRCVRQAIMAVQHVFDNGGNFKDAYHTVKESLHDRRMAALSFKPNWQHIVTFSAVGMLAMVGYEVVRAHINASGGHIPSLLNVLKSAPLVSASIEETKLSPPELSPPAPGPAPIGTGDQPIPRSSTSREFGPKEWGENFDENYPERSENY